MSKDMAVNQHHDGVLGPAVQGLMEPAFQGMEKGLDRLYDILRTEGDAETSPFLSGNFAPVRREKTIDELQVSGEIPPEIRGVFLRNGPNPKYAPAAGYHLFDGDGMIHGVEFDNDRVSYANRWVQTNKLDHEDGQGSPLFVNIGDMRGRLGLTRIVLQLLRSAAGLINLDEGVGRANTAIFAHGGQIWALHEADAPYVLTRKPGGVVETVGRMNFDGELDFPMTAHPRVDPKTGELFFYGYDLQKKPHCAVGIADAQGQLNRILDLGIDTPSLIHDCALTENYFVIIAPPIFFRPQDLMTTDHLPMVFEPREPLRIGVLPRTADSGSEIEWFHLPSGAVFHGLNAWEEDGQIKLYAFRSRSVDLNIFASDRPIKLPPECKPTLYGMTIDLVTGKTSQIPLSPQEMFLDFPAVHPALEGSKMRYGFAMHFDDEHSLKAKSIVKFDLTKPPGEVVVEEYFFGSQCFGGDCAFVPKADGDTQNGEGGYLLTFVRDELADLSYVEIIDAAQLEAGPVATVHIPCRVPYGFHSYFLADSPVDNH